MRNPLLQSYRQGCDWPEFSAESWKNVKPTNSTRVTLQQGDAMGAAIVVCK